MGSSESAKLADLERVVSRPVPMTDIEFLSLPELTQQSHLYLYRENSGLLRKAVRAKVMKQAEIDGRDLKDIATYSRRAVRSGSLLASSEEKEPIQVHRDESIGANQGSQSDAPLKELPSLYMTVAEPSLFGSSLVIRDLGDKTREHPPLEDIEQALNLVARDAAQQTVCLLVPDTHKLVKSDAWNAAVGAIGVIEEPMVTPENYLLVARSYFPQSRLGHLGYVSGNRRFLSRLKKFVEDEPCTPFALSMQIDTTVLGEMENGQFCETVEAATKRVERLALPETLRRFLDSRDSRSLSELMRLVDRLRHDRVLDSHEILTRLYRATARTLEGSDRRYRRLEDPCHCIWAALLLANENSFLKGNAFLSLDYVCQHYARAAGVPAWFNSSDGWQSIAPLLDVIAPDKPSRLGGVRLELQRALRGRLEAMNTSDVEWFRSLIRDNERGEPGLLDGQSSIAIVEAD